jgi:hypothetical protein
MKRLTVMTMAITLVLLISCSGCLDAGRTTPATPVPTATPLPPTTATAVATATVEPLRTLPYDQQVDLQLTKDRTDSTIHLLYNGGKGEMFIQKISMRVTRSDGQVPEPESVMSNGNKPKRGDEIIVQGTRGSDRCEVYVTTTSGITYKVKDESLIIGGAYQGN